VLGVLGVLGVLAVAGCGDDDGDHPDAAIDAAVADAAIDVSNRFFGNWHVVELHISDDGGTRRILTPVEQRETDDAGVTQSARVSGTFGLDPDIWSLGNAVVLNGRTLVAGGMTNVQVYWMDDGVKFLLPLGNMISYTFTGTQLSLLPSGIIIKLERYTPANLSTMPLVGNAHLPSGSTPIATPRVAVAFLLRHVEGRLDDFIVPPNAAGDTNDRPLGTGAAWMPGDPDRTFDLSRTKAPLGVERIDYNNASASVGLIVLYDDKNANGKLDNLYSTGADDIRGVSRIVVTYRLLDDPELRRSRLRFLPSGWAQALTSTWVTIDGLGTGLVPLDNTAAALPVDINCEPAHIRDVPAGFAF